MEFSVDDGEGGGTEVGGLYGFSDEVCFADPGALGVREDDGDGVARGLEGGDEGVDVGGGLVGGGAWVWDGKSARYGLEFYNEDFICRLCLFGYKEGVVCGGTL